VGEHQNLAGIKDSSGSELELRRLCGFRSGVAYRVGNDHLLSTCLDAGGSGSITAAASVAPRLVSSVTDDRTRQKPLDDLRTLMEKYGLIPAAKAILRHRGLGEYHTRPPLQSLDDERTARLIEAVSKLLPAPTW